MMIVVGLIGAGFGVLNSIWSGQSECSDTTVGKFALLNVIVHWIILGVTYGIVLVIYIVGLIQAKRAQSAAK